MTTENKIRIEWIDTAKGICILLVVLNHVLLYSNLKEHIPVACYYFLSAFRMPLYFFLSGLFFKDYGGFSSFIKKKINKLLIPFVFFYLTTAVLLPWCIYSIGGKLPYIDTRPSLWQLLTDFYTNNSQLVNGPLWFLLCLFEINILFYFLKYLFRNHEVGLYFWCILIGIVGLILGYTEMRLPASLDTALTCLPFFCFGYYVRNHTQLLYHSAVDHHLVLWSFLCGVIVFFIARHVQYVVNSFYNTSYFTAHLCGILGTLMTLFLSKRIGAIPIVSYLGRYSIIILCTHILLIKAFICLFFSNMSAAIAATLLFVILVVSELALIPIFRKYLPHVTAQKDLI